MGVAVCRVAAGLGVTAASSVAVGKKEMVAVGTGGRLGGGVFSGSDGVNTTGEAGVVSGEVAQPASRIQQAMHMKSAREEVNFTPPLYHSSGNLQARKILTTVEES